MNSYQLLDFIRRRPAMYIGYESPTHLHSFLLGYWGCQRDANQQQVINSEVETHFSGFHDWVAKKLGYFESTAGWARMIAAERTDQKEAFWLFYQLLDEYRGFKPRIIAQIMVPRVGYFNGLVRHASMPLPMPIPTSYTVEEVLPAKEWVALIAKKENAILSVRVTDNLEDALGWAYKDFGIPKEDWILIA